MKHVYRFCIEDDHDFIVRRSNFFKQTDL